MLKTILTVASLVVASFVSFSAPASAGVKEMTGELQRLGVRVEIGPSKCFGLFGDFSAIGGYSPKYNTICISTDMLRGKSIEEVLTHESVHVLQFHSGVVDPGVGVGLKARAAKAETLTQYKAAGAGCKILAMEAVAWTVQHDSTKVLEVLKKTKGAGKGYVAIPEECAPKPPEPHVLRLQDKVFLSLLAGGVGGSIIYMLGMSVMYSSLFQKWKEKWEYNNLKGDENPFQVDW